MHTCLPSGRGRFRFHIWCFSSLNWLPGILYHMVPEEAPAQPLLQGSKGWNGRICAIAAEARPTSRMPHSFMSNVASQTIPYLKLCSGNDSVLAKAFRPSRSKHACTILFMLKRPKPYPGDRYPSHRADTEMQSRRVWRSAATVRAHQPADTAWIPTAHLPRPGVYNSSYTLAALYLVPTGHSRVLMREAERASRQ